MPEGSDIDFDRYSFLKIDKTQRGLCRLIAEVAAEIDGVSFSQKYGHLEIDPPKSISSFEHKQVESSATRAAVAVLRQNGVKCAEHTQYRY